MFGGIRELPNIWVEEKCKFRVGQICLYSHKKIRIIFSTTVNLAAIIE